MSEPLDVAETVECPSGLTHTRTIVGLPLEAVVGIALAVALPFFAFKTLWAFLLAVPLWAFCGYHAAKDPAFMKLWAGQLRFKAFYVKD